MTSQADVEMSVISKNFFFTFFDFFLIFTIFGTLSGIYSAYREIGEQLRDLTQLGIVLARSLARLSPFYTNYIVLQALGLFPLRLLEFGSVALYPVGLFGAKTPRGRVTLIQVSY